MRPPGLPVAGGLVVLAFALLAFLALAADLVWHGPITAADARVGGWLRAQATPPLTQSLLAATHLHSTLGLALMTAAAAAVLAWRKQGAWLMALFLCVPGGQMLNVAVKHAFQRARPVLDAPVLNLTTYSFPSGHTAGATVWWGFLLVLWFAWQPAVAPRFAAVLIAAAMISLSGLSRVYLGVHYASDVLAAVAEGTAWLVLCFLAFGLRRRGGAGTRP